MRESDSDGPTMVGGSGDRPVDWKKLKQDAGTQLSYFKALSVVFNAVKANKVDGAKRATDLQLQLSTFAGRGSSEFLADVLAMLTAIKPAATSLVAAYPVFKAEAETRSARYRSVNLAVDAIEKDLNDKYVDYEADKAKYDKYHADVRYAKEHPQPSRGWGGDDSRATKPPVRTDSGIRIGPAGGFPDNEVDYDALVMGTLYKDARMLVVLKFAKEYKIDKFPLEYKNGASDRAALREGLDAVRAHIAGASQFDRPTPEMFVERIDDVHSDAGMAAHAQIQSVETNKVKEFAAETAIGNLTGRFGGKLVDALGPLLSAIDDWTRQAGGSDAQAPAAAAETARTAASLRAVSEGVERLRASFLSSVGGVNAAALSAALTSLEVQIAALDERRLAAPPRAAGAMSSKADGMGIGHGLGIKGELLAPGRASAGGFLFRRIDPVRVARYVEQATRFDELASLYRTSEISNQRQAFEKDVAQQEHDAEGLKASLKADGGLAAEPGVVELKLRSLGDARVAAVACFDKQVRAAIASYVSLHRRFMTQQHGEAARYMQYWRTIAKDSPGKDPQVDRWLNEHGEKLSEIARTAHGRLAVAVLADVQAVLSAASKASGVVRLDDRQYAKVSKTLDDLGSWVLRESGRVDRLYAVGSQSLLEALLEPEVLVVYALKLLRVLVAWLATWLASRAFQAMYRQRVYAQDDPPPHPAVFVAMMLGVDAAAHAVVGVLLVAAKSVWHVDAIVIRLWAFDWAFVTAAVAAIALVVAQVVYSKRYFRYKYEGERGIRAMQEMVFCIYCVMIPVPFFRLTFG